MMSEDRMLFRICPFIAIVFGCSPHPEAATAPKSSLANLEEPPRPPSVQSEELVREAPARYTPPPQPQPMPGLVLEFVGCPEVEGTVSVKFALVNRTSAAVFLADSYDGQNLWNHSFMINQDARGFGAGVGQGCGHGRCYRDLKLEASERITRLLRLDAGVALTKGPAELILTFGASSRATEGLQPEVTHRTSFVASESGACTPSEPEGAAPNQQ